MNNPYAHYWTPEEAAHFDRLYALADAIIEEQNYLGTGIVSQEERALNDALGAALQQIHATRERLLAVAKQRSEGSGA